MRLQRLEAAAPQLHGVVNDRSGSPPWARRRAQKSKISVLSCIAQSGPVRTRAQAPAGDRASTTVGNGCLVEELARGG